jgi:2-polyprenyl-3-methyl-5-hydroxy-6-metoxy-1,4-benzoquinol methylase
MTERTKPRHAYQPEWVDGKEVGTGWRDCAGRYDAIKRYLTERMSRTDIRQFKDPTVLELGAYNGYFCHRLHDDFNAQCLAIDGQPFLKSRPGTAIINKTVSPEEIVALGAFDISLCLSVLHHHVNWGEYMQALFEVTTGVMFIELAHPNEPALDNNARTYAFAAERIIRQVPGAREIAKTAPMNITKPLRSLYVVDKVEEQRSITL